MEEPKPVEDPHMVAQDKIKAYAEAWNELEHMEMLKYLVIMYPHQGISIDALNRTLRRLAK